MRKLTTLLTAGALMGLTALVTPETEASLMTFGDSSEPNNGISYNPSTGYILIPFEVTNNDSGTEYSGAVVNSSVGSPTETTSGFQGLYDFGSNSSTYSSISDMLGSTTDGKINAEVGLDDASDYVNNGWITGFNADGSIKISHPSSYRFEHWVDDSNIVNNTAKGTLQIGSWLYDGDGNTGNFTLDSNNAAQGDAIPIIDLNKFISNAAVATDIQDTTYSTSGNYLDLQTIPEPTAIAYIVGAALGLGIAHRLVRKDS